MNVPTCAMPVLSMFRPAFSTPTYHRLLVLVLAAILTTDRWMTQDEAGNPQDLSRPAAARISEEPGARTPHAGIWAGAVGEPAVLPRWGAADKAAHLMGCKAPAVSGPIRTASISGAWGGNEPREARTEQVTAALRRCRSGRRDLGGEQTGGPEQQGRTVALNESAVPKALDGTMLSANPVLTGGCRALAEAC
jgi:hypothetical protein